MTSWVSRDTEVHLGTDRIFTSPTARALYENLLAFGEQASGAPAMKGARQLLQEQTVGAAVASIDFTQANIFSSTYDLIEFEVVQLLSASAAVTFYARVSEDGGATYNATGSRYQTVSLGDDTAQNQLILTHTTNGVGNTSATHRVNGSVFMFQPSSASLHKRFLNQLFYVDNGSVLRTIHSMGLYNQATAINGFRFLFLSNNISAGTIRAWGYNKG